MSSNKKSSSIGWILACLLFLGAAGYFWYNGNNLKTELAMQEKTFKELEATHNELDTEYQNALESIESLRDESKELNDLIDSQKAELAEQKKKINGLIWTRKELDKAKTEIASIQGMADGYMVQINDLKSQIAGLEMKNTKLTEEKEVLMVNLDEQKVKTQEVEEARKVLVSNVQTLETAKSDLENTVDIASAVKVNWLQVTGHQLKDDGKLKSQRRAKRINTLRICYKTETNVVASAGTETFFVRYIDPLGETISIEDAGSGMLTNKLTDDQVKYTTSGTLDYNNQDAESCMDWHSNYPFQSGLYGVEIYNKGYMVGKGDFKFK